MTLNEYLSIMTKKIKSNLTFSKEPQFVSNFSKPEITIHLVSMEKLFLKMNFFSFVIAFNIFILLTFKMARIYLFFSMTMSVIKGYLNILK